MVSVLTAGAGTIGVQTSDGETVEADSVIVATEAWCGELVRKLGIRLPIQAAKGYHRDYLNKSDGAPALRHACLLGEKAVFCTPMPGFVRFAGTLEFSGVNLEIRQPRLEQLTQAARHYLKDAEEGQILSEWCGLRPCLPDGLPAVGPVSRYRGLYIATGHAMQGLTLGPVTGKLMADCILDPMSVTDNTALHPERF